MTMWDGFLEKIENEYRNHPTDYLRQPTISKCLHPPGRNWFDGYFQELKEDSVFSDVLARVIDGDVGGPYSHSEFDNLCPVTVEHIYHLYMIDKYLGISIIDNDISSVVDIGGGYGNLCRIARQLGYTGRYTIADFPLMLEIQEDYLSNNGILDVDFVPLGKIRSQPKSILIATYSINEMPLETRQLIEPHYKSFDYLYFVHNNTFDGVCNAEYFSALKENLEEHFAVEWFLDHNRQKVNANHRIMSCKRIESEHSSTALVG